MKLHKTNILLMGLVTLAPGIWGIVWAKFGYTYWPLTLIGITGVMLSLLSLDCFHYVFSSQKKHYHVFSHGLRGIFFDLLHLSLAILLMIASAVYQRPIDPLCGGTLSGGFPIAFLCDNAGESPISDWGKITWSIDIPNLLGTYVDTLFYLVLLWMISFAVLRTIQPVKKRIQLMR